MTLPKIVQIAAIPESENMKTLILALDEDGEIWALVLDSNSRKWFKTTREVEQPPNEPEG